MIRAVVIWLILATAAVAVEPDEILDDPVLEERARELSKDIRCLVCRSESIDESNAEFSRDLRLLIRERLVAGDTDQEVRDFLVSRFGEYVLLTPQTNGANVILWIAGPVLFLGGLIIAGFYVRRRTTETPDTLSEDEQARLDALLRD